MIDHAGLDAIAREKKREEGGSFFPRHASHAFEQTALAGA